MLLLLTLIFRAVSIEFRSKQPMQWWRKGWDITFSVSSLLAALLIGVAMATSPGASRWTGRATSQELS